MNSQKSKIVDLLYKYELKNDCMGEPSWERLVVEILKEVDKILLESK